MQTPATKADAVSEELGRVLASPGFVRNERLGRFLRFVVQAKLQGKLADLKETVIGVEVFGRAPGYDPRSDAVVRMEAAKLRARLAEYYAGPGAHDPVRFEIPKGRYVPQWQEAGGVNGRLHWSLGIVAAFTLFLALSVYLAWRWTRDRPNQTVAVLPFLNLSPEPDNEYFSDGLTEEITQSLSLVSGLDVTSRTSSFALKRTGLSAPEIGAKLHATALLEGSVRKSGDRLRIIAQLISVKDGKHLWSNAYDRDLRDVFAIQEEIAASIVNALRLKLGGGQRRYTDNLEAYELYLRGRQALEASQPSMALNYFEKTIVKDSMYAVAHAGMSDALLRMEEDHQLSHGEALVRGTAATKKALDLDPLLSEGHTALGEIGLREYQWQEAERSFRRALELNPNNAVARLQLGAYMLVPLRRFDEGIREINRALVLDPLSWRANVLLAHSMLLAGRYKETVEQARKGIALDPNRREARDFLARALSLQQNQAEALAVARDIPRYPEGPESCWLACVCARGGRRGEALEILQENVNANRLEPIPNRRLLILYGCLGDKERAFEYFEKMYAEREPWLPFYLMYPELAWMRTDPRFATLLRKVGLPPT
jgi:serine/threonine-protein kinase